MNQNTVYKILSVFQMIVNFCIINIFVYNTVPDKYANAKVELFFAPVFVVHNVCIDMIAHCLKSLWQPLLIVKVRVSHMSGEIYL